MSSKQKKSRNKITANNDLVQSSADSKTESSEITNVIEDEDLDDLLDEGDESLNSDFEESESNSSFLPRLTLEMKKKLDAFDTIEKRCIKLEEEKSKLEEKIDGYLTEIEALKAKKSIHLEDGMEIDFDEVKPLIDSYKKDISHFKAKTEELRDENDSYLLKISDLTFDNAKLTSQLQEVEKSMIMSSSESHSGNPLKRPPASHCTMKNQPQFTNPYLQNGYQDW